MGSTEVTKRTTIKRKRIIYVRPFQGEIQAEDLQLITDDDLNVELSENEILCEAVYLGIDAGLKALVLHYPDGITMIGAQIAKVTASRNERFPVGAHIYGKFGWQTHTVTNPNEAPMPHVTAIGTDHSLSMGLGCLGVTGNTALFGVTEICRPAVGETMVMSSAAGGVGNLAGQIAKIHGARTIGIAGSEKKCKWLVDKVGFDAAVNYKSPSFEKDLKAATPNGVDCFFDCVGADISGAVVQRMNKKGRIAVCGAMGTINDDPLKPSKTSLDINRYFTAQQLVMRGFNIWDHCDGWCGRTEQILSWLKEGKLQNYETIVDGFENAPKALKALIRGDYKGRVVIKV